MINQQIFFFFYNLAHQSTAFDKLVKFIAVDFIYIVIILAGLFLLFHHKILPSQNPIKEFISKWKEFIPMCASVVLAWGSATIIKILFHTLRPFVVFPQIHSLFFESGFAFPSGHSAVVSAIAVTLFFANKKIGYLFMFFALLVGLARIVAGVHFPIDILGGFILGSAIAYFLKYV